MAKLSARGAVVVARWRRDDGKVPGRGHSMYVLRSDGAVLWHSGMAGSGWVVTIKPNTVLAQANIEHMANVEKTMQFTRRGYTMEKRRA